MQIIALFRAMFSYRTVIATIFLASTIMANAAEPQVVKDAVEAAEWMAKALSSSGYKADFTLDSLKEVDRFVDDQAPGGNPKPGGLLSDHLGTRIFALGAYVGEVIRRQGEGQWRGDDSDPKGEINLAVQLKSGTIFWPMQRIMKRIKNGPEDGIYAYGFIMLRRVTRDLWNKVSCWQVLPRVPKEARWCSRLKRNAMKAGETL